MTVEELISQTFGSGHENEWPQWCEFRDPHGCAAHAGWGPKELDVDGIRWAVTGIGLVVTREDRRGEGLARALIRGIQGTTSGPLVLFTAIPDFYARLGFQPLPGLHPEAMGYRVDWPAKGALAFFGPKW